LAPNLKFEIMSSAFGIGKLISLITALKPLSSRCANRKNEKNIKIIGKYWSCFVQCTNPLLLIIMIIIIYAVADKYRKDNLFKKVTCYNICCFRVASQNGPNRKRPQSKTAPLSVKTAPNDIKNRLKRPHRRISL